MALLVCTDCEGKVSSTAMNCVHCGNVLQVEKPGFIGSAVRVFYFLFTVALVIVTLLAMKNATMLDGSLVLIPPVAFGIWFSVSVSLAILLYVTRHGRIVRVDGATRGGEGTVIDDKPNRAAWSYQSHGGAKP